MTSADSSSKLARALARFTGSQAATDALRAAGTRVLKQGLSQHRALVVMLVMITMVGVGTTLLMPTALAAAIDAVTGGHDHATSDGHTGHDHAASDGHDGHGGHDHAASDGHDGHGGHDHAASDGHAHPLVQLDADPLVYLALLIAIALTVNALNKLISDYYRSRLTAGFRHRLLGRGLALGVPGQRRFPAGDLLSRLSVNAGAPATFLPMLLSAASSMLVSVGAVVALALIDLRLAGTFLLGVPVAVALLRLLIAKAGEPFARYQELLAAVLTRLLDAVRGARTIRASGTADREIGRILQPLPELNAIGRQVWGVQRRASWQVGLLVPMVQVLVLSVGGVALTAGDITAGDLVAAASYVALALGPIRLVDTLISLLTSQVGAGRVGEVLEHPAATSPPASAVAVPPGPGRIELRDVSVRVDERVVLDHLDLTVPAGASVAVVGRSGTGKSVLVSLIGRLLDPDEGLVLLDGTPVSLMDLDALRQTVTYAFERPALLGSSVHDLIAYGRPDASRAEVEAAAAAAQADRFIRLLPDGYDTPLAQAPMSGGERQRLGLARAFLTRARVIVLDDATSSLDTATEIKVVAALERVLARRTSVVIAHRAATAARADLVAWLDAGRIRALASHARLWSDPGYRAVFGADGDERVADASESLAVVHAGAGT